MSQLLPQLYLLLHLTKATHTCIQKQLIHHCRDKLQIHIFFLNSLNIGCQTLPDCALTNERLFHGCKFLENNLPGYLLPMDKIHCSLVVKKLATVTVISSNMVCHLWLIGGYEFIGTDMP